MLSPFVLVGHLHTLTFSNSSKAYLFFAFLFWISFQVPLVPTLLIFFSTHHSHQSHNLYIRPSPTHRYIFLKAKIVNFSFLAFSSFCDPFFKMTILKFILSFASMFFCCRYTFFLFPLSSLVEGVEKLEGYEMGNFPIFSISEFSLFAVVGVLFELRNMKNVSFWYCETREKEKEYVPGRWWRIFLTLLFSWLTLRIRDSTFTNLQFFLQNLQNWKSRLSSI